MNGWMRRMGERADERSIDWPRRGRELARAMENRGNATKRVGIARVTASPSPPPSQPRVKRHFAVRRVAILSGYSRSGCPRSRTNRAPRSSVDVA